MPKETRTAICIVVENLPVPMDRRVWKEACALRDAGYQVSVVCPKGSGRFASRYEELEGVEIYRHRNWEASRVAGYLVEYGVALAAELYLTLKVFAKTKFRILQACNPPDTIFVIALLLRPFGVRFIFDHHDLSPELFETKFGKTTGVLYGLTRLFEACSFRAAKVCIATNESFREIAITRGRKRPEDVFVLRNCPEICNVGEPLRTSGRTSGCRFTVVYVGFMGSQDGLRLLLESIEYIVKRKAREDVQFVLVGAGPELPILQEVAARNWLDSYITFTGQVPYQSVAGYLANADVGVAPDPKTPMNDKSTMIKILEYMAYSLPVVMFDLKEGRRVAGPAALYATPNDTVEFANQITKLLDSETLRRELGACGRKRVEDRLNWETEKASLLEAYETALR
jgi:glycosyltransferase involved in cell wall biosynthesis